MSDAGNTKTGAPPGYHDDCVIALALAAWQVREDQGGQMFRSFGEPPLGNPNDPRHMSKRQRRRRGWKKIAEIPWS